MDRRQQVVACRNAGTTVKHNIFSLSTGIHSLESVPQAFQVQKSSLIVQVVFPEMIHCSGNMAGNRVYGFRFTGIPAGFT